MLIIKLYLTESQLIDAKLGKSFQISAYQMKLQGDLLLIIEIFPYKKYSQLLRNLKNNKGFRFIEGQYKIIGNIIPIDPIEGNGLQDITNNKPIIDTDSNTDIKRTARKVGKPIINNSSETEINLSLKELDDVEENLSKYSNNKLKHSKKQGDGLNLKKVNQRNVAKSVSKEGINYTAQTCTEREIKKAISSNTKSRGSRNLKGVSNQSLYTKIPKNLK